ncbi:MAG: hypothetical protein K6G89_02505 [Clostridia bacterium]|nr:hypothetical protein [Clostridia bacterium]
MSDKITKSQKLKLLGSFVTTVPLGVLAVMAIIIYLNSTFGWFAQNTQVSGRGMSARVEDVTFPDMKAWRFDLNAQSNGDELGDTLDKDGTWVDAIDSLTTTNPKGILPVVENVYNSGDTGEKFKYISLHLGTIDNLLTTSDDNCFYIRFDVTEDLFRSAIGFSLTTSGVHIYSLDGAERTSTIAAIVDGEGNNLNIIDTFVEIFQVDAAISTTEYTPAANQAAIDALFTSGSRLVNGGALHDFGTQSDSYYLYVRFSPDLEKCFEATDHIATYMPCEVTFDVSLIVSFD